MPRVDRVVLGAVKNLYEKALLEAKSLKDAHSFADMLFDVLRGLKTLTLEEEKLHDNRSTKR